MYVCVFVCVWVHLQLRVYVYVYMYVYVFVCVRACVCVCTAVVGEHDCVHKYLFRLATTVMGTRACMSDVQQKAMETSTDPGKTMICQASKDKTIRVSQETGQRNHSGKVDLMDVGPLITWKPLRLAAVMV